MSTFLPFSKVLRTKNTKGFSIWVRQSLRYEDLKQGLGVLKQKEHDIKKKLASLEKEAEEFAHMLHSFDQSQSEAE